MKSLATILIFIISLQLVIFDVQATTPRVPIDIILDIDWTAFYTVDPDQRDEKTLSVEGKLYRPTDSLAAVLESLVKTHPEVRISFFSGGERTRNEALLKSYFLSDGRSLFDISYKVFSKEHLHVASNDSQLRFSDRYKKVLDGLWPEWNPDRTILIDDMVDFARPPLKAVESMGVYNFQRRFDPARAGEKYFPESLAHWSNERQKAVLWLALLDVSIRDAAAGNESFAEAATRNWNERSQYAFQLQRGQQILALSSPPILCRQAGSRDLAVGK